MKFAYLILAHHNFSQLQLLLDLLDDERNDIYVHIDKKIKGTVVLNTIKSKLYRVEDRVNVAWGDISQIKAEYKLFKMAFNNGPYDYYHLLSGDDLPIKSNDYIQSFFKQNSGKEFVGYGKDVPERCTKFHLFTKYYRHKNRLIRGVFHLVRNIFEPLVNMFPKKIPDGIKFKKGAQWISITHNCLTLILDKEKWVLSFFKKSYCCDEVFVQTIVWNSPFQECIYDKEDLFHGCMRLIDWNRGGPYVWGGEIVDYQIIMGADRLFARKFDITTHSQIVQRLCDFLHKPINTVQDHV